MMEFVFPMLDILLTVAMTFLKLNSVRRANFAAQKDFLNSLCDSF